MKLDFLVSGANEVVDDVGRSGISSRTAKPLVAGETLNNAARRVNTAVPRIQELAEAMLGDLQQERKDLRARVRRKLSLFLHASQIQTLHPANRNTSQTIIVVIIIDLGLIVFVVGASPTSATAEPSKE
jgi:hypothetical protein